MNLIPPAVDARATNVRYTVLAWACSLSMLTYIDRVCIKNVQGDMQASLGIDEKMFGLVFSAFGLAYAAFEVPSGWLGDRFGPRAVLVRIVLWWSLFTALTGCVWNFSHHLGYLPMPAFLADWFDPIPLVINSLVLMVIVRFLFGMGEAGAYPNMARALRNWFPYSRRGLAQGLLWAFGRWGGAAAPLLIWMFAMPFGWRGAFIAFGILGALWALLFAFYFRNTPADHAGVNEAERAHIEERELAGATAIREGDPPLRVPSPDSDSAQPPLSWGSMLRSPNLWLLTGMYFCSNAGWCFFITWDVKFYEKVLELNAPSLLIASGAPLFFGGIACLSGGMITDRQVLVWGRRWGRTLQGCLAYAFGGAFFLLALAFIDVPFLSVACLCVASFGKDFAMAVSWSTCIDIGHRYSGTVAGVMNGVGNLGTAFAPTFVGFLAGGAGGDWRIALVFSAILFFLASICWLFINPRNVVVYSPADRDALRARGLLN
jgi:MFS family permease